MLKRGVGESSCCSLCSPPLMVCNELNYVTSTLDFQTKTLSTRRLVISHTPNFRPGKERAKPKDGYTTLEQIVMVLWYHTHSGNNEPYKTWLPWRAVSRSVLAQMKHVMGLLLCFVMMMRGDELRKLELCDCSREWVVALQCWALKFSLDVNKTHNDVSVR